VPRTVITENPTKDAARYLRHWSIPEHAEDHIATVHQGLSAKQRRAKAKQAAFFIAQALEYLDSAQVSSLLTKPLPLFYAAENLAKPVCICKQASITAADFKSHGLKSDQQKRYSVKNLQCSVYASPSKDVWSQLFAGSNADLIAAEVTRNGQAMISDRRTTYATKPLSKKTLLLGDLLRHLPELTDDVVYAGWGHPLCGTGSGLVPH
jgi:hypothetical protein